MTDEEIMFILKNFDFDETKMMPINFADEPELDATMHDDYLLPPECRSYDFWADCDDWELFGRE